MTSKPIKKYCEYYYQVVSKGNGKYGWEIKSKYKDGAVLERSEEDCDTITEAEGDARDAISYYYI
jgi:hypothetical protein